MVSGRLGSDLKQKRKRERVLLETARYRVDGEVMLPPEGYKSRLSDHLNDPNREFLIVLDAIVTPLGDSEDAFNSSVLMVQRARIEIIFPFSELGQVGRSQR
ncbi:MAG: hypothetical protein LC777_01420 [Actinobacteria bacterium]|nr:hypothetical protein [Actinomycetota bacterium]